MGFFNRLRRNRDDDERDEAAYEEDYDDDDDDEYDHPSGKPFCCRACGGPYPDCMDSCKIFED